ncbi:geranylgeranyl pyrophosphate synthetase [Purpureocillium takamizusanense]|uniref:Geranylgeranyl pyrophosphate synthetase n=1 Tax=Purpureocillium takamizusanense TaxID=2060973 RepID=A0A9Q8QKD2_9HYPO|nr:geranylgeranyl pyrophosphate synthetase [Purpureocillium takamizusanense]UNI20771.1 geranylgeranyl pyrophosphate synthetase [Purpureocillium takamizusanense]
MSSPPRTAVATSSPSSPQGTPGNNTAALTSPNAIPPRTSSTGLHHQHINRASLNAVQQSHAGNTAAAGFAHPTSLAPSVLVPVSEAAWIGQRGNKPHHHGPPGTDWRSPALCLSPGLDTMRPQSDSSAAASPYQGPGAAERYASDDLNFTPRRCWTQQKEAVIRAPFDYALSHPGKSFRAQLVAAFNAMLDVPPSSLEVITRVIGMLHEASLLIDDVQDSSELRRGFPVAHNIFGVPQTINSANYMCYVGLQELQRLENPRAVSIFAEELVNLHRGQGMDLYWRDTLTCPTEDDYLEMVGNKTGGLFRLGIKLMQAESSADVDCVPLVNLVGLIYQIRDDYLNLASEEYTENKGMCEDLTEGKFSFPVIHSIRSAPANMQLLNILKQKTSDIQIKRYAVSYMEGTGSFAYTRAVIATLIQRARRLVVQMDAGQGKSAGILKILDKMEIIY